MCDFVCKLLVLRAFGALAPACRRTDATMPLRAATTIRGGRQPERQRERERSQYTAAGPQNRGAQKRSFSNQLATESFASHAKSLASCGFRVRRAVVHRVRCVAYLCPALWLGACVCLCVLCVGVCLRKVVGKSGYQCIRKWCKLYLWYIRMFMSCKLQNSERFYLKPGFAHICGAFRA